MDWIRNSDKSTGEGATSASRMVVATAIRGIMRESPTLVEHMCCPKTTFNLLGSSSANADSEKPGH